MTGRYAKSWLEFEESPGLRPVLKGMTEEIRSQHGGLMAALTPQYPSTHDSIRIHKGNYGDVKFSVYYPATSLDSPLPVGVYYHPGGLAVGPSIADEYFCAAVANYNNTVVVAVEYRLSTEFRAPVYLDDALDGLTWAVENANKVGGDPTNLYVKGVSAGAGLAVSVTRNIVLEQSHAKPDIVKGMILLYPTVFHPDQIPAVYRSLHTSSIQHKDNVPLVDGNSMRLFFDLAGTHASDMDYFPALDISCHSRFPPTYVATSEMDSLRDDDRVLAQSLKDAGIRLKTDHYSGLPHCFWIVPSLPETREFMQNSHSGIQYILDQLYRQIVRLELFIIMSNAVHFLWFVVPTDRTSVDP